jgi:hypothetical protein
MKTAAPRSDRRSGNGCTPFECLELTALDLPDRDRASETINIPVVIT